MDRLSALRARGAPGEPRGHHMRSAMLTLGADELEPGAWMRSAMLPRGSELRNVTGIPI